MTDTQISVTHRGSDLTSENGMFPYGSALILFDEIYKYCLQFVPLRVPFRFLAVNRRQLASKQMMNSGDTESPIFQREGSETNGS